MVEELLVSMEGLFLDADKKLGHVLSNYNVLYTYFIIGEWRAARANLVLFIRFLSRKTYLAGLRVVVEGGFLHRGSSLAERGRVLV